MNLEQLLQNAIAQEQEIAQQIERLARMRFMALGQIDLLRALVAQQQQPVQAEYIEAPSG